MRGFPRAGVGRDAGGAGVDVDQRSHVTPGVLPTAGNHSAKRLRDELGWAIGDTASTEAGAGAGAAGSDAVLESVGQTLHRGEDLTLV